MEALSPQQALQGFEDLVSATLHPQQFSIYLLGEKGLELALMHGWKEGDSYRRHFESGDVLYQAVMQWFRVRLDKRGGNGALRNG